MLFVAGTFSKTRFGTTKIKSDPMKQLIGLMTSKGGQVAGVDEHRSEQMDAKILKLQPPPLFRQNQLFRKPPTPPEVREFPTLRFVFFLSWPNTTSNFDFAKISTVNHLFLLAFLPSESLLSFRARFFRFWRNGFLLSPPVHVAVNLDPN
jgi:hypothetical protein